MNTDPFTSWRYRIGVRCRALPKLATTVIYIVGIAAYIWLVAYIFHVWPWTREWHWWYIPQVGSLFLASCIGLYVGFSMVFDS